MAPAGKVHNILTRDGHHVAIVQNPTLSLADDVVATRRIIDAQDGPVVLVGHSQPTGVPPRRSGVKPFTSTSSVTGRVAPRMVSSPSTKELAAFAAHSRRAEGDVRELLDVEEVRGAPSS